MARPVPGRRARLLPTRRPLGRAHPTALRPDDRRHPSRRGPGPGNLHPHLRQAERLSAQRQVLDLAVANRAEPLLRRIAPASAPRRILARRNVRGGHGDARGVRRAGTRAGQITGGPGAKRTGAKGFDAIDGDISDGAGAAALRGFEIPRDRRGARGAGRDSEIAHGRGVDANEPVVETDAGGFALPIQPPSRIGRERP